MSIIDIKKSLQIYGLEEKEIKVYLAVLRLGNATVKEIAEVSKVKRTTVYLVAEKLTRKGIFGQFKAKYGTHYVASSPRSLINRLDNIKSEVNAIIPQLEAIENKGMDEPSVRYYKGKEGYLQILDDSLNSHSDEILYLGSETLLSNILSEDYITKKYIPERIKKSISFREIIMRDQFSIKLERNAFKELRQIKFLPDNAVFRANTLIFRNKVAYLSSKKELTAVLIESQDIADAERQKFELLWIIDRK